MQKLTSFSLYAHDFPIKIGLHQGPALSPYLFAFGDGEVTRNIQGNISWCILFADDVVLVEESRAGVIRKLELWKDMLESKGFGLSRTKTKYMMCAFSATAHEDGDISLDGQVVAMKETFRRSDQEGTYQCGTSFRVVFADGEEGEEGGGGGRADGEEEEDHP